MSFFPFCRLSDDGGQYGGDACVTGRRRVQSVAGKLFRDVSVAISHDASRFRINEIFFRGQAIQEEIDAGNAFRRTFPGAVARVKSLEDDDGFCQFAGDFPADGTNAFQDFPVRVFRKVVRA